MQVPTGWQARASKLLRHDWEAQARRHIRKHLDRWEIPILPGHRVDKWLKAMHHIANLIPPRVITAVFRTAFNGWITHRRMQGSGGCILGCPDCPDSIEHYALCHTYHGLCKRWLNLDRPPTEVCLARFIGIGLPGDGPSLVLRSISVFALYKTHNALRHSTSRVFPAHLYRGFLQDGVRGHPKAMSLLAAAFKRPRHED